MAGSRSADKNDKDKSLERDARRSGLGLLSMSLDQRAQAVGAIATGLTGSSGHGAVAAAMAGTIPSLLCTVANSALDAGDEGHKRPLVEGVRRTVADAAVRSGIDSALAALPAVGSRVAPPVAAVQIAADVSSIIRPGTDRLAARVDRAAQHLGRARERLPVGSDAFDSTADAAALTAIGAAVLRAPGQLADHRDAVHAKVGKYAVAGIRKLGEHLQSAEQLEGRFLGLPQPYVSPAAAAAAPAPITKAPMRVATLQEGHAGTKRRHTERVVDIVRSDKRTAPVPPVFAAAPLAPPKKSNEQSPLAAKLAVTAGGIAGAASLTVGSGVAVTATGAVGLGGGASVGAGVSLSLSAAAPVVAVAATAGTLAAGGHFVYNQIRYPHIAITDLPAGRRSAAAAGTLSAHGLTTLAPQDRARLQDLVNEQHRANQGLEDANNRVERRNVWFRPWADLEGAVRTQTEAQGRARTASEAVTTFLEAQKTSASQIQSPSLGAK